MASRGLALMIGAGEVEAGRPGLLERAKAGDLAAFEQIVIEHERLVYVTALRLLGRPEDAQDAAQEVFLRLYKHLRSFELRSFKEVRRFWPWLYRITVNVCRDAQRRRARGLELSLDDAAEIPSAEPQPGAPIFEAERRRILTAALARLSERERAALVLRDLEGLTSKEVARILGSREGTVRVQIASARLKMRKFAERLLKGKSS